MQISQGHIEASKLWNTVDLKSVGRLEHIICTNMYNIYSSGINGLESAGLLIFNLEFIILDKWEVRITLEDSR